MSEKVSLEKFLKQQEDFYENHVKHHPANAFCGTAGDEEMAHVQSLVDELSDEEVAYLVKEGGFSFPGSGEVDRDTLEGVVDEIDREDFYRLLRNIHEKRKAN